MPTAKLRVTDKSKLPKIYSGKWSCDFSAKIPSGTAVMIAIPAINRSGNDFRYEFQVRVITKATKLESLEEIADFFAV